MKQALGVVLYGRAGKTSALCSGQQPVCEAWDTAMAITGADALVGAFPP